MFSFFSKKPSETEAIAFGNSPANRAILDVVFKEGVPTFVIVVDQRGADIRSKNTQLALFEE